MTGNSLITSDPHVLCGKPCIKGTRISVELLLGWLAMDWSMSQILEAYPHITRSQVLAAIDFARDVVKEEGYLPTVELAA